MFMNDDESNFLEAFDLETTVSSANNDRPSALSVSSLFDSFRSHHSKQINNVQRHDESEKGKEEK